MLLATCIQVRGGRSRSATGALSGRICDSPHAGRVPTRCSSAHVCSADGAGLRRSICTQHALGALGANSAVAARNKHLRPARRRGRRGQPQAYWGRCRARWPNTSPAHTALPASVGMCCPASPSTARLPSLPHAAHQQVCRRHADDALPQAAARLGRRAAAAAGAKGHWCRRRTGLGVQACDSSIHRHTVVRQGLCG